jgi:hypothetical protein
MMKRVLLGACAVMIMAGIASAQTASTNPPPPPPPQDQQADGQGPEGWGSWWGGKNRGGHHGHHGGDGMRGGPDMPGKGFSIVVGQGKALRINCGEEPMKDCIASAQPLIEALNKAPAQ